MKSEVDTRIENHKSDADDAVRLNKNSSVSGHELSWKNVPLEKFSDWIWNRSINLSLYGDYDSAVFDNVMAGVYTALNQARLRDFDVISVDLRSDVQYLLEKHMVDERLDATGFARDYRNLPWRVRDMTGDIILFPGGFKEGTDARTGQCDMPSGVALLGVPEDVCDYNKLRRLAIHESFHLLGAEYHHGIVDSNMPLDIKLNPCATHGETHLDLRTDEYCPYCLKILDYIWDGIETRTGEVFRS